MEVKDLVLQQLLSIVRNGQVAIIAFLLGFLTCYLAVVKRPSNGSVVKEEEYEDDDDDDDGVGDIAKETGKYPSGDEMKMVLVIRTDLQMGKGKVS